MGAVAGAQVALSPRVLPQLQDPHPKVEAVATNMELSGLAVPATCQHRALPQQLPQELVLEVTTMDMRS